MKVKIKVDGTIITRVIKHVPSGNFVMNVVRYKNNDYLIGEGDEYLRGYENEKVYELGRKLT